MAERATQEASKRAADLDGETKREE